MGTEKMTDLKKKKTGKRGPDRAKFTDEIEKLLADPNIQKMARFGQHRGNNTLDHVVSVAWVSFDMAEELGWEIDEKSLARGAILHDYYLYDIKQMGISDYEHGVGHPGRALKNARTLFNLSRKEENIILSHMWPLTLFHPPRSKEAILVTLADKYCAGNEMVLHRNRLGKRGREAKKLKQHDETA